MSPEAAVALLAEILGSRSAFSEDEVYAELAKAGVPDSVADRAYKFTQTAWGRVLLADLRVPFDTEYMCFNGQGEVIESGLLADSPYFAAAMRLAPRYAETPGFRSLALCSADASAVNNALHAGKDPSRMAMGPAGFFMEAATPAGMDRARRLLTEQASAKKSTSAPTTAKKPWWQFW